MEMRNTSRRSCLFHTIRNSDDMVQRLRWGHPLHDICSDVEDQARQRAPAKKGKEQKMHRKQNKDRRRDRQIEKLQDAMDPRIPRDRIRKNSTAWHEQSARERAIAKANLRKAVLGQHMPGAVVCYGMTIALQSMHGRYLHVNPKNGKCTCESTQQKDATLFTFHKYGSPELVRDVAYQQKIVINLTHQSHIVLGGRIKGNKEKNIAGKENTSRTRMSSHPNQEWDAEPRGISSCLRQGEVVKHMGCWHILNPKFMHEDMNGRGGEGSNFEHDRLCCHLSTVVFEQDWYYLAVGAENKVEMRRRGNPDNAVPQDDPVHPGGHWKVHLISVEGSKSEDASTKRLLHARKQLELVRKEHQEGWFNFPGRINHHRQKFKQDERDRQLEWAQIKDVNQYRILSDTHQKLVRAGRFRTLDEGQQTEDRQQNHIKARKKPPVWAHESVHKNEHLARHRQEDIKKGQGGGALGHSQSDPAGGFHRRRAWGTVDLHAKRSAQFETDRASFSIQNRSNDDLQRRGEMSSATSQLQLSSAGLTSSFSVDVLHRAAEDAVRICGGELAMWAKTGSAGNASSDGALPSSKIKHGAHGHHGMAQMAERSIMLWATQVIQRSWRRLKQHKWQRSFARIERDVRTLLSDQQREQEAKLEDQRRFLEERKEYAAKQYLSANAMRRGGSGRKKSSYRGRDGSLRYR